ncbi:MAG: Ribosomal RNA small subunit methyltransferase E [Candidatus Ozemobacter sibiricus]|uniref:Ribosomal RNA small subunit methyltransferase E n=1 Tax=Candidatus Ozemobacter sibiricus TaxID=2268124 RepID=A0A367ZNM3_9BACT|nr:MAG: Ribosomal RNA small subunit methyltransferase E [Candidatus Ozemobacter sibiricus]
MGRSTGTLTADQRHHLEKVLRLRPGDVFVVTDGVGREATARLEAEGRFALIGPWGEPGREPDRRLVLWAALIKGDRFEWVIEKAVEMGVAAIVPVQSARCVVGPPSPARLARWRKIAEAAMLQCGGCRLPEVRSVVRLNDLPPPPSGVIPLLLHEEPENAPRGLPAGLPPHAELWVLSGPEGGLAAEEVERLVRAGWRQTWLGPRRLRADTAPLVALAGLLTRLASPPSSAA